MITSEQLLHVLAEHMRVEAEFKGMTQEEAVEELRQSLAEEPEGHRVLMAIAADIWALARTVDSITDDQLEAINVELWAHDHHPVGRSQITSILKGLGFQVGPC